MTWSPRAADGSRADRHEPGHQALGDPGRRYATAAAFADDLGRLARGEPILARPPGLLLHTGRWLRRHRVLAAIVVLLVAGVTGTSIGAVGAAARASVIGRQKDEISAQKATIEQRQSEFDLLAHVVHLRGAKEREAALYPAWPERLAAIESWLAEDAVRLREALPELKQAVESLQLRAGTTGALAAADGADADQLLLETLRSLVGEIETFTRTTIAEADERRAWARRIGGLTTAHPGARQHPVDLLPQTGLVPIGMNPSTRLWEFYDLRSAWDGLADPATISIPSHDSRGHIAVGEATGIVFVLLPGGTFTMGAQNSDPRARNFDPQAVPIMEGPPHAVTLAPFFLARHQLTQGQWQRLARGDLPRAPSTDVPGGRWPAGVDETITLAHPVTHVDWWMCERLLAGHGLVLPTEAQWEYGCRAGTTTPWSTGSMASSLRGYANVRDQRFQALWPTLGFERGQPYADWDDGFALHAPVDALGANPWGLHHVHGNASEWVHDLFGVYEIPVRASDGLRLTPTGILYGIGTLRGSTADRVMRSGPYNLPPSCTRSSFRLPAPPESRFIAGVRAARRIMP